MKVIDEKGRVFGKINISICLYFALILSLAPLDIKCQMTENKVRHYLRKTYVVTVKAQPC